MLCINRGGESDHFQLKGSMLLILRVSSVEMLSGLGTRSQKKQRFWACWDMVTFYKEHVLNPKPSQLCSQSPHGITVSSSSNGKKSAVVYIRMFLISLVFLHRYKRPGLSRCLSMLYLNHKFLSCLTVSLSSQLGAFAYNDPNHLLSFHKGKKTPIPICF